MLMGAAGAALYAAKCYGVPITEMIAGTLPP